MRSEWRDDHIEYEILAEYVDGTLLPAEKWQVTTHLRTGCRTCREDLAWLEETIGLMQADDWQLPPEPARASVRQAYRRRSHATPSLGLGDRWQAWLARNFRPVALAATFLFILVLAGAFITVRATVTPVARAAELDALAGEVAVRLPGDATWEDAAEGMSLPVGTEIRTGDSGTASVLFFDESVLMLAPATELTLVEMTSRLAGRERQIALFQPAGRSESQVSPAQTEDSQFRLDTPSLTIRVVGTQFTTEVTNDGLTQVYVAEGLVSVIAAGEEVAVPAGTYTTVAPGTTPAVAQPAPPGGPPTPIAPPGLSGETPGQLGDTPGQSGNTPGQGDTLPPGQTGDTPGQSGDTPGQSGDTPGQSGDAPGQTGDTPGQSGAPPPGQGGDPPGQGGDPPGQGGDPPGQGGDNPGQGNNPPGQDKDKDNPGQGDD